MISALVEYQYNKTALLVVYEMNFYIVLQFN